MASNLQFVPKWQKALFILTGVVLAAVLVAGLQWGRPVLIPIATAVLLTVLLSPIVQRLHHWGIHYVASVLLTVSAAAIVLVALGWMMTTQITRMLAELPQNTETIKTKIRSLRALGSGATAKQFGRMMEEIGEELTPETKDKKAATEKAPEKTETAAAGPAGQPAGEAATPWFLITGYLGSAVEVLGSVAFSLVLIVFFLLEGRELRDRLVVLAGKARLTVTSKALEDISDRITRYLGMVAIINGGFGLTLSIALYFLGMPYALLWGFVAGGFRFIPFLGPWIGAVFPITMSMALSDGWWQPVAVLAAVVGLELVTNNVVEPLLFGRTTGVSPTALLISAAFWLFLWGPLGLVLSIPFAVCFIVIGKNIPELHFLPLLLGDEPALPVEASFYQRVMLGDAQEALAIVALHAQKPESKNVYDEFVIPALNFAKRDVRQNRLTMEDYESILDTIRDLLPQINELIDKRDADADGRKAPVECGPATVIACPVGDEADRLALSVLQCSLKLQVSNVEITTAESTGEGIGVGIAAARPDVICIASIPPGGLNNLRRLCRQLRAAVPDVPIVIGRWGTLEDRPEGREQLIMDGASFVTTTQSQTCDVLCAHLPLASKPVLNAVVTSK